MQGGFADVADGALIDVIRRVAAFGLTLVPLDLRQESTRHMMAVDAITKYLGTSVTPPPLSTTPYTPYTPLAIINLTTFCHHKIPRYLPPSYLNI